jgi:hypothetical protein
MCFREIRDMDIVANTRSIRSIVIRAKDCDTRTFSDGGFQNNRDQMRFRIVILSNFLIRIAARCIKSNAAKWIEDYKWR